MKNRTHPLVLAFALALVPSACRGEATPAGGGAAAGPQEPWHGESHGDPHPLGKVVVGGIEFDVTQLGDVEAGGEAAFEIALPAGASPPGTVRAWIGVESSVGSRMARLEAEDGHLHAHLEVPAPLPADGRLWLEVGLDAGPARAAIGLHR